MINRFDEFKESIECLGTIIIFIAIIVCMPLISFGMGFIIGLLIKWIFGEVFVSGLSLLGINILVSDIPLICGVLNVIGSFFRSSTRTVNKRK